MVDDIAKIESPLFQITPVKKVREVTPRPQDRRHGRDTYLESDEVGIEALREDLDKKSGHHDEHVKQRNLHHPTSGEAQQGQGQEHKKDKDHLLDVIA